MRRDGRVTAIHVGDRRYGGRAAVIQYAEPIGPRLPTPEEYRATIRPGETFGMRAARYVALWTRDHGLSAAEELALTLRVIAWHLDSPNDRRTEDAGCS